MSQGERKIADATGRFAMAVVNGQTRNQLSWQNGRIVLSNRRLIVANENDKRIIPLSDISKIGGPNDEISQEISAASEYVSVHLDDDVLFLETGDTTDFELYLFQAVLNGITLSIKHPAVRGGVVQDTDWIDGRIKLKDDSVAIALASGSLIDIDLDAVTSVELERREASDGAPTVINIEYAEDDTTIVTTISGSFRLVRLLAMYIKSRPDKKQGGLDLGQLDQEVLIGLYSGVSPFELPEFVGIEVDKLEESFDRLIEANVLDEVRVRREVELTPRGRNLASEAMSEQ